MVELESEIGDGEYSIEIRETRMGRLAALNKAGERTLTPQEHTQLENLLGTYEDVILDLFDAEENLETHERTWKMGKIYHDEIRNSDEREIKTLSILLPFATKRNRQEYRCRLFYNMFPDQNYEQKYSVGTLIEFAQRTSPSKARDIYDNILREKNLNLKRDEVRLWSDIESFELTHIVDVAKDSNYDNVLNADTIRRVYLLNSADPPDESDIKDEIDNHSE